MEIQKMRYGDTFSYEIHAEEGTENIRIPPILIQTFIENAIKHSNTFDDPIIIRTDIAWMTAGGNSHEIFRFRSWTLDADSRKTSCNP